VQAPVQASAQTAGTRPAAETGRTVFVGEGASVAGHRVHPVLSVDSAALAALPRLGTTRVSEAPVTVSLTHGLVEELLRTATHALAAAEPPASISPIEADVPDDALRRAAKRLVHSAASVAGLGTGHELFDALDALASTGYEGQPGSGTVILTAEGHPHVDLAIRLRSPVPVRERLQFRKLLEIADHQLGLLVDGTSVFGLGAISEQYDGATEDLFRLTVVEQGVWTLSHHGQPLLRVANGRPQLPRPRMPRELFEHAMHQVFSGVDDGDVEAIWRLAQTAVGEGRGTMLVVTTAAQQEAHRLAPQAIAIDPQPIGSRMLRSLTRIDGGVLLTPDGVCHAVGVILDGIATGVGDPGRGARYNSAVRYLAATPAPCLALIISDDGMIDILPEAGPAAPRLPTARRGEPAPDRSDAVTPLSRVGVLRQALTRSRR
jgi:hypothetical protein